ncbi:MAG: hypothetical protein RLZZ508_1166, partial [Actinomycetota bacterium]
VFGIAASIVRKISSLVPRRETIGMLAGTMIVEVTCGFDFGIFILEAIALLAAQVHDRVHGRLSARHHLRY